VRSVLEGQLAVQDDGAHAVVMQNVDRAKIDDFS
jgi:hypothetical protein